MDSLDFSIFIDESKFVLGMFCSPRSSDWRGAKDFFFISSFGLVVMACHGLTGLGPWTVTSLDRDGRPMEFGIPIRGLGWFANLTEVNGMTHIHTATGMSCHAVMLSSQ